MALQYLTLFAELSGRPSEVPSYVSYHHPSGEHFVSVYQLIKKMRDGGRDMQGKYKEPSRGGLAINVLEVPVSLIEC